jgi:hypothetical protein
LKVHNLNSADDFVSYNTKGMACKIHPGHPSAPSAICPQMKELAGCLLLSFKEKTVRAEAVAIH